MPGYTLPAGNLRKTTFANSADNPLKLLLDMIQQQQSGYNEARQANESRYLDILDLLGGARTRSLDALKQFGQSLINDTNKTYTDKRNSLISDLADRGLAASTQRIPVELATQRERDAALNRIQDMLIQDRLKADESYTDKATGVMERRSDPYPDTSQSTAAIAQLASLFGSGALGTGGYLNPPNRRVQYTGGPGYVAPQPVQQATYQAPGTVPTTADSVGDYNQLRNTAMANLYAAYNKGGIEGSAAEKEQLANMIRLGLAEPSFVKAASIPFTGPGYWQGQTQVPVYWGGYNGRVPLQYRDPTIANRVAGYRRGNQQALAAAQAGPQTTTQPPLQAQIPVWRDPTGYWSRYTPTYA